jgi:pimeloyl-ACP methyl ester carboxylesterase
LVALIPGGRQVIVEGTGHDIHVDKPEVLIAIVMEMIKTISSQAV